ncbi:hypothetical protein Ahia01_000816400, partial [Argonauta hians]
MARKKTLKRSDEKIDTVKMDQVSTGGVEEKPMEEEIRIEASPELVAEEIETVVTPLPVEGPLLTSVVIKSYNGNLVHGLFEGEGMVEFIDGHVYRGDFQYNCITGKGIYTYTDGSTYEGEVENGKRHGYGVYTWEDEGKSYSGYWYKGKKQGKGCMQF